MFHMPYCYPLKHPLKNWKSEEFWHIYVQFYKRIQQVIENNSCQSMGEKTFIETLLG